ncbi:MAG: VTT domain-containing protein [Propionibacteriaceae bacterium]
MSNPRQPVDPPVPDVADREALAPDAPDPDGLETDPLDPDGLGPDAPAPEAGEDGKQVEKEWWNDPRLPWRGKPGRKDILCWTFIAIVGIYALILIPLRPIVLGLNPYALSALNGSRTAIVAIGARASQGDRLWPLGLVMGTLSTMKFDWIYWWAGKLWGHGLIEVLAGKSKRSARNAARAERVAAKIGTPAVFLSYYIPLLPSAVIYAAVGAARMRLRTFLIMDFLGAVTTHTIFLLLGYKIGAPALRVVNLIAKYSWYLGIGLLVVMIAGGIWRSRRKKSGSPA